MPSQLPNLEVIPSSTPNEVRTSCCPWLPTGWGFPTSLGLFAGVALTVLVGGAFLAGRHSASSSLPNDVSHAGDNLFGLSNGQLPPEILAATASHGGSNMAVCTGQVAENGEGFFALDFITGELKGWVFNPVRGNVGLFNINVQPQLGPVSKNPEYLLVTGAAASAQIGGNLRTGGSLIYVVDMRSGFFAAYSVPWDRSIENGSGNQLNPFVFVTGGQIRDSMAGGAKKPAGGPAAAPGAKKPNDPNAAGKPADPNNANANNANGNNANPNNAGNANPNNNNNRQKK